MDYCDNEMKLVALVQSGRTREEGLHNHERRGVFT